MAAAEELQPQQSMLEDASPTPTAAEHDAVSNGEPSDDGGAGECQMLLSSILVLRTLRSVGGWIASSAPLQSSFHSPDPF